MSLAGTILPAESELSGVFMLPDSWKRENNEREGERGWVETSASPSWFGTKNIRYSFPEAEKERRPQRKWVTFLFRQGRVTVSLMTRLKPRGIRGGPYI